MAKRQMQFDFAGRLKNIPMTTDMAWYPLFEAVLNSIHAIKEVKDKRGGTVIVKIYRGTDLFGSAGIESITIEDDGAGFGDKNDNFKSFLTSDTTKKIRINGKGIGRFLWLKSFENINIRSIFEEDGKKFLRKFTFSINGVDDDDPVETNDQRKTIVELKKMKKEFSDRTCISLDKIAKELSKHIIAHLIVDQDIEITLIDGKNQVNLNHDFFANSVLERGKDEFYINEQRFTANHLFVLKDSIESGNKLYICAQNRVVISEKINKVDIPSEFAFEDRKYNYICFISGPFLDRDVVDTRNEFTSFVYDSKSIGDVGTVNGFEKINNVIEIFLKDYIEDLKREKEKILRDFIINEEPQFSYLYHNKDQRSYLKSLPYDTVSSDTKLRNELQNRDYLFYKSLKEQVETNKYNEDEMECLVNKVSQVAKSNLASYVIRRKLVIELLERCMQKIDNKNELEDTIHNLIFPKNNELDTVHYEDHNLWLIDERLSFAYKGFSEKQMNKIMKSESKKRSDMMFITSFSRDEVSEKSVIDFITIVEFKRPGLESFSDSPKNQVLKYIQIIKKSGMIEGYDGESLAVAPNAIFNCYIIGTLTKGMTDQLVLDGFQAIANNDKWIFYHPTFNASIEFTSYRRIITDSKLRNKIFQEKLELD